MQIISFNDLCSSNTAVQSCKSKPICLCAVLSVLHIKRFGPPTYLAEFCGHRTELSVKTCRDENCIIRQNTCKNTKTSKTSQHPPKVTGILGTICAALLKLKTQDQPEQI